MFYYFFPAVGHPGAMCMSNPGYVWPGRRDDACVRHLFVETERGERAASRDPVTSTAYIIYNGKYFRIEIFTL